MAWVWAEPVNWDGDKAVSYRFRYRGEAMMNRIYCVVKLRDEDCAAAQALSDQRETAWKAFIDAEEAQKKLFSTLLEKYKTPEQHWKSQTQFGDGNLFVGY